MKTLSLLNRPALVAAVAGSIMLAGTVPASADTSRCTTDSGCAGKAAFQSYGEILSVTDQVGDGHSAVALYWLPNGTGPHLVWNSGGKGTTVKADLELPEGSWIHYRVCLGEFGTKQVLNATCGAPITDYA